MKTLVLGLGNPVLGDDGVGIKVAHKLQSLIHSPEVTVEEAGLASLDVLELLIGYERALIIDAVLTDEGKAGDIRRLDLDNSASARHCSGGHDIDLFTALELGRRLGLDLPLDIVLFAIEVKDVVTLSEELSPAVDASVCRCLSLVLSEIGRGLPLLGTCASPKEPKVLIVDDEPILREGFCEWLNDAGYSTLPADSGEQALEMLRGAQFDVLVTDYGLPGINGMTLLEEVREFRPALKSIIMTASPSLELKKEAAKLNSVFLAKPVRPIELEKLINESLAS